ncbi:MAG: GNAT family N-acetyltransferase [Bacteroidota bacterium]
MIETDRLVISPLTPADAPFIYELLNSPPWLKYIGDRNVHSVDDALRYLENRVFPAYRKNGLAGWRVALKENDFPIGNCGFYQRDFLDTPDFGFAFLPEFIGKGYGYEAAQACLDYGIEQLGIKGICAITVPHNLASIGLLKKLGFKLEGTNKWPDDPEVLELYRYEVTPT